MLFLDLFYHKLGISDDISAGYMDRRPCVDLGLPPYTLITHSVKRWQLVEPDCTIVRHTNLFVSNYCLYEYLTTLGQRKQVCLQWPSHVGVPGNEAADELAECRSSRAHQTALARLGSGHLRSMTFVQGVKSFFTGPCSLLASPAHLLDCWGVSLRQLYEEQDLVCETITRKGQMDLV
ncbi:uncharacterized protein TNCV_224311 [Trichonephila clavipes]|nr:uncharacterized protein TNCV_224311 [Trichonephila clavipes]